LSRQGISGQSKGGQPGGWTGKLLRVDLSDGSTREQDSLPLTPYIGGRGFGARLAWDELEAGIGAFDPGNLLMFLAGPLTGTTAPFSGRGEVCGLGPQGWPVEWFTRSGMGGHWAPEMKYAGYDGVVIKGQAEKPVYLWLHDGKAELKDAAHLWGLGTYETQQRLLAEHGRQVKVVAIGQAGERLSRIAIINSETESAAGQGGFGAVMGAKKLKAIVVGGDLSFPITDVKRYIRIYDRTHDLAVNSPAMQKYHEIGTAQNVLPLNAMGALPTRNLQAGSFEGAEEISGEAFAEDLLLRKYACFGCPVGCIHIGLLRQEFAPGYEYRYAGVSYDYELIFSLGSVLGVSNRTDLLALIERVEELGLDAMSAGVVLAWLTEAREKGLVPEHELGVPLAFGAANAYLEGLNRLVKDKAEVWQVARRGSAALAARYGGDFALQVAGNEVSGYHTGYGSLLGHAIGSRHSHLDAAGYSLDQQKTNLTPNEIVEALLREEQERCVFTALHACLFARKLYGDRALVREALATLGFERTEEELDKLGRDTLRLKHRLKAAMGFTLAGVRLPQRFYQTPTPNGPLDEESMQMALAVARQRIEQLLAEAPPETPKLAQAMVASS